MPFSAEDIVRGMVIPALASFIALALLRFGNRTDVSNRYRGALAILLGTLLGYSLLSLGPWIPTAHWHWLPSAMILAAIVGPVSCAEGVRLIDRILLYSVAGIIIAWFLVPEWEDLEPSRTALLIVHAVFLISCSIAIGPLAEKTPGPIIPMLLLLMMFATAIVLAQSGSLRFAQIALAGGSAILGVLISSIIWRNDDHLRGTSMICATLVVGLSVIGRVHSFSDVPLASYILLPLSILLAWLASWPKKPNRAVRILVSLCLPTIVLIVAVGMALLAEAGGDGY